VDAVSSEPVSGKYPDKQGINREFSQNHPIIGPIDPSNTLVLLVFWVEFPKHRNREYFQRNREFNPRNRELSGWIREPPYGPPQRQIGGLKPPRFDSAWRLSAKEFDGADAQPPPNRSTTFQAGRWFVTGR
jgi:hypothetical protein